MKKLTIILVSIFFAFQLANAQTGVSISEDNSDPDNSAMLDVQSTDKGVLVPRVTLTADLTSALPVTNPAEGLLIYNTGANQANGFYYWTGTQWKLIGSSTETDPVFSSWDKDYADLTNTPAIFSGSFTDLTNKPTTIAGYGITDAFDGDWSNLTNTPTTIAGYGITDAFSGSYTDLTNKPDLTIYATKDMNSENITNLADPVNNQDAATKAYVDLLEQKINTLDNTLNAGGKVTDIDGNSYNTVKIGNQIWMAEDLRVTTYPNGTPIPHVTDNTAWVNLTDNNTDDAYCFYNNDNTTDYGALYTYAAAIGDNWTNDNATGQGVCPDGWHLPTDAEWTELTDYLGGTSVAGGKLKESGTTHWNSPNTGATNESGFSALPSGVRTYNDGTFQNLGNVGTWWSASEYNSPNAWIHNLIYNYVDVTHNNTYKSYGFSVRCVKD